MALFFRSVPARQAGAPIPARLPPDTPVFNVPDKLCKILNRDLRLAGIPKRDDRGRVLDVHALRHTFGTLLSKGGVSPRTAQAAMRHSKIDLTMTVYTDPKLLDVAGALDTIPALPLCQGATPKGKPPGQPGRMHNPQRFQMHDPQRIRGKRLHQGLHQSLHQPHTTRDNRCPFLAIGTLVNLRFNPWMRLP